METLLSNVQDWYQTYRPQGTPWEKGLWVFWCIWLLLIFGAVFRVIKFRFGLARELKALGEGHGLQKPAVVIVPIKGASPRLTSEFFQSLLEQDYWKYRLIVAVETSDDPVASWLFDQFGLSLSAPVWAPAHAEKGLQSVHLVIAGKSRGQGQKIQNQLAAFEVLRPEDAVIAFVDSDIVCPKDWLSRLAAPVNRGDSALASTYRWLVPVRGGLASQFASVINASIATQGGNIRENMPWGGSMAISREAFDHIDVPKLFAGSLNDDLHLGKAAKRLGYRVTYIRSLVRPTQIDFTWGSFLEFARRQYLQAKIFAPILYSLGNLIFILYLLGWVTIIAALFKGHLWAWVPVIVATILDQIRASTRESIYRALFGHDPEIYRRISRVEWIEHFLTPVYMLLHGCIIFSTWFMNKVEWGGIKYQIEGVNKTRVLGRRASSPPIDLASIGNLALPAGGVFPGTNAITHGFETDEPTHLAERVAVVAGGGSAAPAAVIDSDKETGAEEKLTKAAEEEALADSETQGESLDLGTAAESGDIEPAAEAEERPESQPGLAEERVGPAPTASLSKGKSAVVPMGLDRREFFKGARGAPRSANDRRRTLGGATYAMAKSVPARRQKPRGTRKYGRPRSIKKPPRP